MQLAHQVSLWSSLGPHPAEAPETGVPVNVVTSQVRKPRFWNMTHTQGHAGWKHVMLTKSGALSPGVTQSPASEAASLRECSLGSNSPQPPGSQ